MGLDDVNQDGAARERSDDVGAARRASGLALPLVIDADTTVSRTNLLLIAILAYLKPSFARLHDVLKWALGGRAHLARRLAAASKRDCDLLPMPPALLEHAAAAAAEGRAVYLVTARETELLADVAAQALPIREVISVSAGSGATQRKRDVLAARFAEGYQFASDRRGRIEIVAETGATADQSGRGGQTTTRKEPPLRLARPSFLTEVRRSLRLHQWVKNFIVFVPLILGGRLLEPIAVSGTILAFLALSLMASGTYILNDTWDMIDDRKHWSKRFRPIASGHLSVAGALGAAPLAILAGLALGLLVSPTTVAALLIYLSVTLAYTFRLKTVPFLDGFVLASLFTVRLAIGAAAADVPPSPWLFVFSMFLFASLSFAKRHTEIARVIERQDTVISGRGYRTVDAPMALVMGLSTGIAAVLIMVLYIVEEAFRYSFYGNTQWLWGFPPLVFLFVTRVWFVSARGEMADDPVAFAIKDRVSLAILAMLLVCFAIAWLGTPWTPQP